MRNGTAVLNRSAFWEAGEYLEAHDGLDELVGLLLEQEYETDVVREATEELEDTAPGDKLSRTIARMRVLGFTYYALALRHVAEERVRVAAWTPAQPQTIEPTDTVPEWLRVGAER